MQTKVEITACFYSSSKLRKSSAKMKVQDATSEKKQVNGELTGK